MPLFSNIAPLLRAPVGNNLENRTDDVLHAKRNFAAEGRYKRPVENGYIDRELDDAITSFQRDNNLKIDGIMNPGGETEATLTNRLLNLPKPRMQLAGAALYPALPLLSLLGVALGMKNQSDAEKWWLKKSPEDRDEVTQSLDYTLNNGDHDPKQHCEDDYEESLKRCKEVERRYGPETARICRETAFTRYSQCRTGKPAADWRNLHEHD